ncbi:MAG: hypothetical protein U9N73_07985, partial [Candidatus Auribacterota bacterium]|nr:hypothetical protein [Candidatus Auribacterota bacterium]
MKTTLISIFILFSLTVSGYAKPIRLEDFNWGMTLLEVEAHAPGKNYILTGKELSGLTPHLKYETHLYGRQCTITFFFTPLGQKLYSAKVSWDLSSFGDFVRDQLIKKYKYPREEMPGAKISIWTRKNTEVELRYGFEETTLTYSNLDLWN